MYKLIVVLGAIGLGAYALFGGSKESGSSGLADDNYQEKEKSFYQEAEDFRRDMAAERERQDAWFAERKGVYREPAAVTPSGIFDPLDMFEVGEQRRATGTRWQDALKEQLSALKESDLSPNRQDLARAILVTDYSACVSAAKKLNIGDPYKYCQQAITGA